MLYLKGGISMREIFGIKQAAKLLGMSPDALRSWDNSGEYVCDFKSIHGHRKYYADRLLLHLEKAQGGKKFASDCQGKGNKCIGSVEEA